MNDMTPTQALAALSELCHSRDDRTALSVIERHVQDMEKALRPFVPDIPGIYVGREYEEAVGIYVLPVHLREARRVLAALPAREKEEE